jgi:elongation factor P
MSVNANDLRKGMAIRLNGEVYVVLETTHRTPGNLRAFVQATVRSVNTGKSGVQRFGSTEKIEDVMMTHTKLEFSYKDNSGYHFIDPQSYEDITLQDDLVGGLTKYLTENLAVEVMFVEGKPVTVQLPSSVTLKVVDSPEGIRGDSANNVMKTVTMETGLEVQAPLFIKEGELLKISTSDGSYMSRA